jgi:hypothetical protein
MLERKEMEDDGYIYTYQFAEEDACTPHVTSRQVLVGGMYFVPALLHSPPPLLDMCSTRKGR